MEYVKRGQNKQLVKKNACVNGAMKTRAHFPDSSGNETGELIRKERMKGMKFLAYITVGTPLGLRNPSVCVSVCVCVCVCVCCLLYTSPSPRDQN